MYIGDASLSISGQAKTLPDYGGKLLINNTLVPQNATITFATFGLTIPA